MKISQTQDSGSGCRAQVQETQRLEVTPETHTRDGKQREMLLQKKLNILGIQHRWLITMLSAEITPKSLRKRPRRTHRAGRGPLPG
jgi:hypothetical protein